MIDMHQGAGAAGASRPAGECATASERTPKRNLANPTRQLERTRGQLARHPIAILAWAVAVALATTALLGALKASHATTPQVKTSQFVRRSELGMDVGALNQAANAAIRADLRRVGLDVLKTTIYRTTIDGDRGTVTALVDYGTPDGSHIRKQALTLIFHYSLWSLGQITPGMDPSLTN